MRKVVINDCYGGFGLSDEAIKLYIELSKSIPYIWSGSVYKQTTVDDISSYDARNNIRYLKDVRKNEINCDYFVDIYKISGFKISELHNIERDDEFLVKVVESLGESANGQFSDLKIVKIPKDVEWEIQEYDGIEWVAESHRTWS